MGIRVAAFLALFVACAAAASSSASLWTDSNTCSGAPDRVTYLANIPFCSATNCTGITSMSTTTECDVAYERPTGAAFINAETYSAANCGGSIASAIAYRADVCQEVAGTSFIYTCKSDGSVAVKTCTDSACSSGCTTSDLPKGCSTAGSIKYECSSGVRTFAVAGLTAAVAAVASFWSM